MLKKNKPKVLIIDDNYPILKYLKTVFERYQFEVKTSTNGYEGLQDAAEFRPDIIFLDLMMPNIDGIKMLQLKKVLNDIKDIPVIVISANAGRNNVLAAIEAGADRVLAKPVNVKQLKAAVDELIGGKNFEIDNESIVEETETGDNKDEVISVFNEKFDEHKNTLLEAVNNRNSKSVKNIVVMLKEYCKGNFTSEIVLILDEMINKEFTKPSDWMHIEMKIKQIEKELKQLVNQF